MGEKVLHKFLSDNTKDIESVCELGAGIFIQFPHYRCPIKIGIELIQGYIDGMVINRANITDAICGSALDFEELLGDREIDAFALIDFIEHLPKDVGLDLLKRIQTKSKRIFIFVPYGTCNQNGAATWDFLKPGVRAAAIAYKDKAIDAQIHRSSWYPNDLEELGFTVEIDDTFIPQGNRNTPTHGTDGGAVMFAVWNKQ